MLLEGPRVIAEAEAAGLPIALLALREGTSSRVRAAATVILSRGLFRSLSQVETPQGVLAVATARRSGFAEALAAARAAGWPLVVLDGVQDPGNVGAIARTCAAAGVPALAVLEGTADPFGPKAVRASAGNVFRLAVARADAADLAGLRTVGAAAAGGEPPEAVRWDAVDALVLGSEAHGLRQAPGRAVTIPVAQGVESLNVAAAAAVLLFAIRAGL